MPKGLGSQGELVIAVFSRTQRGRPVRWRSISLYVSLSGDTALVTPAEWVDVFFPNARWECKGTESTLDLENALKSTVKVPGTMREASVFLKKNKHILKFNPNVARIVFKKSTFIPPVAIKVCLFI